MEARLETRCGPGKPRRSGFDHRSTVQLASSLLHGELDPIMPHRIAINGFGRVGRMVLRQAFDRPDIDVVAVNDLARVETLANLLERDSVHGHWDAEVRMEGGVIVITRGGIERHVTVLSEPRPEALPWVDHRIDTVVESTGRFRTSEGMVKHLSAGARRVLLSAPARSEIDATIVRGVNDADLHPGARLISAASCTTNCLAPIVKILDEAFGIERGLLTTVHAYTNDQAVLDLPHHDLRRARAAAINIVPTSTGAARSVTGVYPRLAGKLDGVALRVPVACGSVCDFTFTSTTDLDRDAIDQAVAAAAAGPMAGIVEFSDAPLVSQDIIGRTASAVFDGPLTQLIGARMAKVFAWYDNEWAYSARVVDLLERLAGLPAPA